MRPLTASSCSIREVCLQGNAAERASTSIPMPTIAETRDQSAPFRIYESHSIPESQVEYCMPLMMRNSAETALLLHDAPHPAKIMPYTCIVVPGTHQEY